MSRTEIQVFQSGSVNFASKQNEENVEKSGGEDTGSSLSPHLSLLRRGDRKKNLQDLRQRGVVYPGTAL